MNVFNALVNFYRINTHRVFENIKSKFKNCSMLNCSPKLVSHLNIKDPWNIG